MSPEPLFEFGHGLSYTRFEYANLRIEPAAIRRGGTVVVSADVANVGTRRAGGRPALPARPCGLRGRPGAAPAGFEKLGLAPGETKTVRFTLRPDDFALFDAALRWTVEPGAFEVAMGSSSRKIHLTGRFECYPREVRGAGRAIAAATDQPGRKVRTPQGSVLANGQRGRPQGKCHRKHTAELAGTAGGKGEKVR